MQATPFTWQLGVTADLVHSLAPPKHRGFGEALRKAVLLPLPPLARQSQQRTGQTVPWSETRQVHPIS